MSAQRPCMEHHHPKNRTEAVPIDVTEDGDPEKGQRIEVEVPYEGMPGLRKRMKYIFPALAVGLFLVAADETIIAGSYGKIGSDLHALEKSSWIATVYFLSLTSVTPFYGKLSDIFGRKSCIMCAYSIFAAGNLFCGLAKSMSQLIGARAVTGVGAAGLTTVVSILLTDILPLRIRGRWQGYVNIIFAAGGASGSTLGGVIADSIGWRWGFIAQVPFCIAGLVAITLTLNLPSPPDDEATKEASRWNVLFSRVDYIGILLLVGAVCSLLFAFDMGSNVGWKSVAPCICVPLSIVLFGLFLYAEWKVVKEPIAPLCIIFSKKFWPYYACNFFSTAGVMAAQFYVPLFFQAVKEMSAAEAGLRMAPGLLGVVSGSLFGGFMIEWTDRIYWLGVCNYAMLLVGMLTIFLCSGTATSSISGIMAGLCINAFALSAAINATLVGIIGNAGRKDQAVATGCSYLFRSLGNALGVSICATVVNSHLRQLLTVDLPRIGSKKEEAFLMAKKVRQSLGFLRSLPPELQSLVSNAYGKSISLALGIQIGFVFGAAVFAWFMKEKPQDKEDARQARRTRGQ